MVVNILPTEFVEIGLTLLGTSKQRLRNTKYSKNVERFRANFGVGPAACSAVFRDLQTTSIQDARIDLPNRIFFLLAVHWLCAYPKEAEASVRFNKDEKTLREHIKEYVNAIAALKDEKIVWNINNNPETFLISVDGVHFRCYEPRKQPNARWCSYKFKSAAFAMK